MADENLAAGFCTMTGKRKAPKEAGAEDVSQVTNAEGRLVVCDVSGRGLIEVWRRVLWLPAGCGWYHER